MVDFSKLTKKSDKKSDKPKKKKGKEKDPFAHNPTLRVQRSVFHKAMVKSLLSKILIGVLAVIVVYLCFAVTIIRAVPTDHGIVMTKNNTFGSNLPKDQQFLIQRGVEVNDSVLGRIQQTVMPQKDTAIVQVISGPGDGKIEWNAETGELIVGGNLQPIPYFNEHDFEFFTNNYFAMCLEGACDQRQGLIFDAENVIGIPVEVKETNIRSPQPIDLPDQNNTDRERPISENSPQGVVKGFYESLYQNNPKSCPFLSDKAIQSYIRISNVEGVSRCEDLFANGEVNENSVSVNLEKISENNDSTVILGHVDGGDPPLYATTVQDEAGVWRLDDFNELNPHRTLTPIDASTEVNLTRSIVLAFAEGNQVICEYFEPTALESVKEAYDSNASTCEEFVLNEAKMFNDAVVLGDTPRDIFETFEVRPVEDDSHNHKHTVYRTKDQSISFYTTLITTPRGWSIELIEVL